MLSQWRRPTASFEDSNFESGQIHWLNVKKCRQTIARPSPDHFFYLQEVVPPENCWSLQILADESVCD